MVDNKNVRVELAEKTISRHDKYYNWGDYFRIAEMANTSSVTVKKAILSKSARLPLAQAIATYYEQKEILTQTITK